MKSIKIKLSKTDDELFGQSKSSLILPIIHFLAKANGGARPTCLKE